MRSRALFGLLLACSVARAQALPELPAAAPLKDTPLVPALPLVRGMPAPEDGVFLSVPKALDVAERCQRAQVESVMLKQALAADPGLSRLSTASLAVAFVAGLLVGGGTLLLIRR